MSYLILPDGVPASGADTSTELSSEDMDFILQNLGEASPETIIEKIENNLHDWEPCEYLVELNWN